MSRRTLVLGCLCASFALVEASTPLAARAQDTHWLVVSGLGGEEEFESLFREWGGRLHDAVQPGAARVRLLAEDPASDAGRVDRASRKEDVLAEMDSLAARSSAGDLVVIVLIGHGSFVDGISRLNLPGPDITDRDFATALEGLAGRKVVFINTASASGEFVATLSARDRVILTATKTGGERNQTRFAGFLVEALEGEDADQDKNGRISVLEAFRYARRLTLGTYEADNRIATEHALIDDDADGEGSEEPDGATGDGVLAATWTLAAAVGAEGPAQTDDPVLRDLFEQRRVLEARVTDLRTLRPTLEPDDYQRRLEDLLLELAALNQRIQARGGER